jgi:nitrite reductase (NO-forming)
MVSEGAAEHDFTVDELGVHVVVAPGETVEVTIPEDAAPGEYEFYCSVPGHAAAGMVGTLVVQEVGAAAAPAGDDAAEGEDAAAASPAAEDEAAAGSADVGPLIAIDIGWVLGDLSTLAGDTVTLTVSPGTTFDLVSEGAAEHDFVVDELGVDVTVAPGETTQVTIPEDAAAGEYEFYCSVPGHAAAGMVGTLVVE